MKWGRDFYARWRTTIFVSIAALQFHLATLPAAAQFYVNSPEVKKGETKIEEHGALYAGPGEAERLRQSHSVELKHGFTDRFEVIVEGVFRQSIGESIEARLLELGAQYEIVKRHGDGLGLAFRTFYVCASGPFAR